MEGDITRVQVKHNRRHVQLFMTVREAKRETKNTWLYFSLQNGRKQRTGLVRPCTNKGRVRDVTVYAQAGSLGGRTDMTKPSGRRVKCRVGTDIDYVADRISVAVPRGCLGRPRWVRVGIGAVTFEDDVVIGDDALTSGPVGNNPVMGPRVRRG